MSPVLDDRGRLFGRVSLIDILVVLLLIALVAFGYARLRGGGGPEVAVTVTFNFVQVRGPAVSQVTGAFKKGDSVYDNDTGTLLGQVVRVDQPTQTQEETVNSAGEPLSKPSPFYKDVKVVVKGTGQLASSTVRIGSVQMDRLKQIALRGIQPKATIWEVSWP